MASKLLLDLGEAVNGLFGLEMEAKIEIFN